MPFIEIKTSKKLTPDIETAIKTALGEAICVFPGKSESWLMCSIADGQHMWFKGNNTSDSAFAEVKLFGPVDPASAERFTAKLCDILETHAGVNSDRIYVRYTGGNLWGWNGANF